MAYLNLTALQNIQGPPKLGGYLVLTLLLIILPQQFQIYSFVTLLLFGRLLGFTFFFQLNRLRRVAFFILLPIFTYGITALLTQNWEGAALPFLDSFQFASVYLLADIFTHSMSAMQIRRMLRFFPNLAVAVSLFLTYLPWLQSEIALLKEAAKLRGPLTSMEKLTIPFRILINILIRGMERAVDSSEALELRRSGLDSQS